MASLLHLSGYAKEVYSVIFGFWIRYRKSVTVPYSVIKKITGATDPTISACIKYLIKRRLITADPNPGQRTRYEIVMSDDIWKAYLRDSGKGDTTKVGEELKGVKNTTLSFPDTTKSVEEQKKGKSTIRKGSPPVSNLSVPSASSVSSRVKTVKISHTP